MTKLKWALILLLFTAAPCFADGIVVGFTNIQAVSNYSQSVMDRIGQFRWYFAHASVGGNMMSGISALHSANATFYRFTSTTEDGSPPGTTANGMIYEDPRGNPSWQAKYDYFTNSIMNGWRNPKINLALDKLCYIDQMANITNYLNAMTNAESRFPDTLLVYATMPIMTSADNDNYLRNLYNDALRTWVSNNHRVLFDIADIEAHDTNGVEYTFVYNSRTNQLMYGGNSSDGGHLSTLGCRQVALGFYAVAYALLTSDRDSDGMSDGEELIAGMCPTSSASVFKFECPSNNLNNGTVISWPSTSNRYYFLERITNLIVSASTNLLTNSAATPPMNCYTDSPAGAGPFFYKVGVRQ